MARQPRWDHMQYPTGVALEAVDEGDYPGLVVRTDNAATGTLCQAFLEHTGSNLLADI